MKTVSIVPQPGSGVRSEAQVDATSAYLQGRLRIFYGVSAVAIVGFLLLMELVDAALGAWSVAESLLDPSQLAHMAAAVGMLGLLVVLHAWRLTPRTLRTLDAAGLLIAVAGCLVVYSESYEDELSPLVLTILSTFVIARAIVVPSTVRYTLLLSLAAPAGLLVLHLVRGPQSFVAQDPHAPAYVIWHQAVLLFSVAVAAVAARVTFSLRNRVAEAQRLGEYRLESLLGEGGMGRVYRATHAMLRRPTAIKVLDPGIADPRTLARFEREVRLTSRLQHPSNVQIYDYGTTADGLFYYAMEYLDGMDLLAVLEAGGPMEPARVLHVLRWACAALGEAHDLGLVHRDLKPANIMLCRRDGERDVVEVLDYGIARDLAAQAGPRARPYEIVGTPDYMAPEVIRGETASPASDVYALGATAYHVLSGWRVFGSRDVAEQLAHHVQTTPIPPSRRRDGIPADLEALVLRCLAKDPAERYPDARGLGAAVAACADSGAWDARQAEGWWGAQASAAAPG